ncbi:MAG: TetR/AcrR family transcriptional regulator [Pseudomonadota bacterium]
MKPTSRTNAQEDNGKPRRRGGLTRKDIVAAALEIARQDGVNAVSMRRVAKRLNAGTMSLYAHVESRRDLVIAMLDRLADAIDAPAEEVDPRADILSVARTLHQTLSEEEWAVDLIVLEGEGSLNVLPLIERLLAALLRLGCAPEDARDRYLLLMQYIYGECLNHRTREKRSNDLAMRSKPLLQAFPATASIVALGPIDRRKAFDANIRRILP